MDAKPHQLRPRGGPARRPTPPPRLSVVVPVYRDWAAFEELSGLIAAQAADMRHVELIAVDNDPGTPRPPLPGVTVIDCADAGSYPARNAGAAAARGNWLVFTDADCRPQRGWLAALAAAAAAGRAQLVAGPVDMVAGSPPNRWEIYDTARGIPQRRYVAHGYAATANLMVEANLFRRLGGFDAARRSGGDADFCRRARASGATLVFLPAAGLNHPARASRSATMQKARRIKGGQIAVGSACRRAWWVFRTLVPPVHEVARYLVADRPWRMRLIATAVRAEIWMVELAETVRLLAGHLPER